MSTTITDTVTAPSPAFVRAIKNGFGAEIFGLDFANGVNDDGYHFIEDAVKKVSCEGCGQRAQLLKPIVWLCCCTKNKTGRRDPSGLGSQIRRAR